jgi:predicted ArsR family transcriptional regulator
MDPTTPPDLESRLAALAPFAEPVRRALYRFVVTRGAPVSREQAADGIGVALHVAKFHLDRLEAEGLLEAEYRRPPGRGGPGAGRPAKLYRRSDRQLEVSVPERRYDLAGHLLARAVTAATSDGTPLPDALEQAAGEAGRAMGATARQRAGRRATSDARQQAAIDVLGEMGYEPRGDGDCVVLANCPFHALAEDYTELICGLNQSLLRSLLAAAGVSRLEACLDPAPGRCCVALRPPQRPTRRT